MRKGTLQSLVTVGTCVGVAMYAAKELFVDLDQLVLVFLGDVGVENCVQRMWELAQYPHRDHE